MFYQSLLRAVLTSTLFLLFQLSAPAQSEDRSKTINDLDSLKKELIEKEKQFLSPSAKDLAAHAEFLKQPNTGLIRLFPRGIYEDRLTIRGGGAYYSFAHLTHEYGSGSDLHLEPATYEYVAPPIAEYNFKTGFAGADYGFLALIGDVSLEKVTLDHKAVKFLLAYNPPSLLKEVRKEQSRALHSGVGKDGYAYRGVVKAIQGYTYILRSINFDHSDVMVAFSYLRRDKDGAALILWKMLKQFPRPELLRSAP
jgi:hypothetical protein